MVSQRIEIIFDENVPYELFSLFEKYEYDITSVQRLGLKGIRNGDLSKFVNERKSILLTRDKDFQFLWDKYDLNVIYLSIHPPIVPFLRKPLEKLLKNHLLDLSKPWIYVVQSDVIKKWEK